MHCLCLHVRLTLVIISSEIFISTTDILSTDILSPWHFVAWLFVTDILSPDIFSVPQPSHKNGRLERTARPKVVENGSYDVIWWVAQNYGGKFNEAPIRGEWLP
jgi:hypothetical protein